MIKETIKHLAKDERIGKRLYNTIAIILYIVIIILVILLVIKMFKFQDVVKSCEDDFNIINRCGCVPCSWANADKFNHYPCNSTLSKISFFINQT